MIKKIISITAAAFIFLAGCSSVTQAMFGGDPQGSRNGQAAGENEAELVVQRGSDRFNDFVNVFVDGNLGARLARNSSEKIILPNGSHSISVSAMGITTGAQQFIARSNRMVFRAQVNVASLSTLVLIKESDNYVDPAKAADEKPAAKNLAQAIELAAGELAEALPDKARIAVISVAVQSGADGFAADELTRHLVAAKKFSVVDRANLDAVRAEQKLQMSGEVDDDTVISLGKLSGAETVITGNVSGSGSSRRLTVKALAVQSSEIQAMSTQRF